MKNGAWTSGLFLKGAFVDNTVFILRDSGDVNKLLVKMQTFCTEARLQCCFMYFYVQLACALHMSHMNYNYVF